MDPAVIGNDVRYREHPGVPSFGKRIGAGAGEPAARRDQAVVHEMHTADHRPHTVEVVVRPRGAGQDARLGARLDQRPDGLGAQRDVRIQVDARKGLACLIAEPQRRDLAGQRRLDHPHADAARRLGGAIRARIRHDDDVELAGGGAGEQRRQVGLQHGFFVVRRHHDAHDGPRRRDMLRACAHPAIQSSGDRNMP
ncbi:MAG TPA: hypothetical protein VI011_13010 [Asanoa sp.]